MPTDRQISFPLSLLAKSGYSSKYMTAAYSFTNSPEVNTLLNEVVSGRRSPVAIVGRHGSGKTKLIQAVARLTLHNLPERAGSFVPLIEVESASLVSHHIGADRIIDLDEVGLDIDAIRAALVDVPTVGLAVPGDGWVTTVTGLRWAISETRGETPTKARWVNGGLGISSPEPLTAPVVDYGV
ncbi:hypothetical protein [Leifsonia sp. Leaf264]|uniref:hypothetical protein n=1 Tax=Leifsonia sp. Leaf264 TaxID=1736314 RepID=UPI000701CB66|nr:hypothetical protein [Leifsonia sp. Leaf264]KQP01423.1 hypothetical protein ASF30_02055 [Leifsonia sp. Leaf264]